MPRLAAILCVMLAALILTSESASAWWLAEVGLSQHSLVIGHMNECGRVVWNESETPEAVVVWESVEPPGDHFACLADLRTEQTTVPLAQPLAGRHVEGGARPAPFRPLCVKYGVGHPCPIVPRLEGLSPEDARFLLAARGLRATFRIVGHHSGLAHVVRESPLVGAALRGRVLRVEVVE
jgi:hypothetical protein